MAQMLVMATVASVTAAVRRADACARLGRLFACDGYPESPYDEAREQIEGLPCLESIRNVLTRHTISQEHLIRSAIGDERAIERGRVRPMNSIEAKKVMALALRDGFTLDSRWWSRWEKFASTRPYAWCWLVMNRACKNDGTDLSCVAFEAARELGLGYERKVSGRFDAGSQISAQLKGKLASEFLTTEELGSHPGLSRTQLQKHRKRGTIIGFRVVGSVRTFHPVWQFDQEMKPLPVISRIIPLIAKSKISIDELQSEMYRALSYRGVETCLRNLLADPSAADWIVSELYARLLPGNRSGPAYKRQSSKRET